MNCELIWYNSFWNSWELTRKSKNFSRLWVSLPRKQKFLLACESLKTFSSIFRTFLATFPTLLLFSFRRTRKERNLAFAAGVRREVIFWLCWTITTTSTIVVRAEMCKKASCENMRRENSKWIINIQISEKINTREKLSIFSFHFSVSFQVLIAKVAKLRNSRVDLTAV